MKFLTLLAASLLLVGLSIARAQEAPAEFVPEEGFTSLFNGKDLSGWIGRPEFWSVEDGVITGRTTPERPTQGNTFLIAQEGDRHRLVENFDLRLQFRIVADNTAGFGNSGIQYRSVDKGEFVVGGYQADFEAGKTYSGILYDEAGGAGGRGIMAERGEKVVWTADGQKLVTGNLGKSEDIQAAIKPGDWNEYRVIARGNRLQHFINGVQTVDVIDQDPRSLKSGVLALQVHAGEPMTVQFRHVRIRPLASDDLVPAGNVTVPKGFQLDLLYTVPKDVEGSWVTMCVDPKGRLIVGDQYGKLYRITPPALDKTLPLQPEVINLPIGGAHGLLYAFDSLYVVVNELDRHGLYRLRDTNGDDKFDDVKLLREISGGGEHGLHSVLLSPDGKSLYIVCGNSTNLTDVSSSRLPRTWGEDNLVTRIPTGFMDDSLAPQGWIAKTDPDGKDWELVAAGLRNEFDLAFNHHGEAFTYDADMEWDIGAPWYRPTRINHVISGAEYGFRNGSGKWPEYFIDSFGTTCDIGPGSPTGITFGYGAKFPAKYQEALFICDWSFGKLRAVHLKPQGSSYVGESEEFLSGQPLPVTDVVVNPHDGAMYFAVGGRNAQSALYRLTYVGSDSTAPAAADNSLQAQRDVRRKLELFHGHADANAVNTVWPYLSDPDRATRYAARIALEWQDPQQWSQKALEEKNPRTSIAAIVALARASGKDSLHRRPEDPAPNPGLLEHVLFSLNRIDATKLPVADQLDLLRAYQLAFIRLGQPSEAARASLAAKCEALFPSQNRDVNVQMANLLVYLQAPKAAEEIMAVFREASTQEEQIEYALALRALKTGWTMPLREEYFRWFVTKAVTYRGGNTFAGSLQTMARQAMESLTEEEKKALQPIFDLKPTQVSPQEKLAARTHVKDYTLAEAVQMVEQGLAAGGRDYDRGRKLFGEVACSSCHRFDQDGGSVGPELTAVAGRFSVRDLMESIVEPNKVISDQYQAIVVTRKDGTIVSGRVANLGGDGFDVVENMLDPGRMTRVERRDIETIEPSKVSMMPAGLLNTLKPEEIQDLVAYMLARGDRTHRMFSSK